MCRSSISISMLFRALTAAPQVNSDSSSWSKKKNKYIRKLIQMWNYLNNQVSKLSVAIALTNPLRPLDQSKSSHWVTSFTAPFLKQPYPSICLCNMQTPPPSSPAPLICYNYSMQNIFCLLVLQGLLIVVRLPLMQANGRRRPQDKFQAALLASCLSRWFGLP